jgi:hypothetical protein
MLTIRSLSAVLKLNISNVWWLMLNQEINPSVNAVQSVILRIKRCPKYIGWMWKVRVSLNGFPFAKLANGEECFRKVPVGSTIDVEVTTFAWRNIWTVHIMDSTLLEFGFSYWGSGFPFRYQNVKLIDYYGCKLLSTGLFSTKSQRIYNWVTGAILLLYIYAAFFTDIMDKHIHLR